MQKISWILLLSLFAGTGFCTRLIVHQDGFSPIYGTTPYTTIQSAIDNCVRPCDEILVADSAVYAENVTFDSTRTNIVLHSLFPKAPATIRYKDTLRTHPHTNNESVNGDYFIKKDLYYDYNGALRFIYTSNIRVSNIKIDGGGRFPYGWNNVWGQATDPIKYPLMGGNAAVMVRNSKGIHIDSCKISNAWYGIYSKGRNEGGLYGNPNPGDVKTGSVIPLYNYANAGGNLYEYNHINDNVWRFLQNLNGI